MTTDATVYRNRPQPRIGLKVDGTADLTLGELHKLIDYLVDVANHANDPDKYTMPDRVG